MCYLDAIKFTFCAHACLQYMSSYSFLSMWSFTDKEWNKVHLSWYIYFFVYLHAWALYKVLMTFIFNIWLFWRFPVMCFFFFFSVNFCRRNISGQEFGGMYCVVLTVKYVSFFVQCWFLFCSWFLESIILVILFIIYLMV